MLKRLFDIVFSFTGFIVLSPLLLVLGLWVILGSKGGMFYRQERIGRNGKVFRLFKFRSMYTNSDKKGLLTVGGRDPRITPAGYYLRRYKLDELPQLLNVLIGDMSLVGPRPEVKKYVDLYTPEQRKVLLVRPGITDYASLEYFEENDLLARSADPEKTYIEEIMPAKLRLNERYIMEAGLLTDLKIILRTLKRIVK
ncbi:MAG: sugar transferase [Sediminibacterium sp.]|nr:sugar transferase [Sediminibacterium sp.]